MFVDEVIHLMRSLSLLLAPHATLYVIWLLYQLVERLLARVGHMFRTNNATVTPILMLSRKLVR